MFLNLHLVVLFPFLLAVLTLVLGRRLGRHLGWALVPFPLACALYLLSLVPRVASGESFSATWNWVPSLGLSFSLHLDGFSLLFALLISGIGALVTLFSIHYLDPDEDFGRFYLYILLFMGAMFGVVLSDNLLALYMFWEITSISSFLLIGFWHEEADSRAGALKSMLVTMAGGLSLLAGIVLMGIAGGSFSIRELADKGALVQGHPYYTAIVVLVLLGAFTKSAQAPFHLWLPGAMAAPTPVSAYLHSATMVKAGIFLTAKMAMILGGTGLWFGLVAGVGMVTMLLGSYLAVQQRDLKGLLAFSTVSQLGFMMAMFGYGTPEAQSAGVFHLLNHALFKGSLFLLVGIIDHQTGTREIDKLSGLRRAMPFTFAMMALSALSMAGVPLLNGFVSKEMILAALLEPPFGHNLFTVALPLLGVAGSVFTTFYSLILAHRLFFGPVTETTPEKPREGSWGLLFSPALLTLLVVVLGIAPGLVEHGIVGSAVSALRGEPVAVHLALWHGFNLPLLMSLSAILLGLILYLWQEPVLAGLRRVSSVRWNVNALYDGLLQFLEVGSDRVTRRMMTGYLRDYLVLILGFTALITGYALARSGIFGFDWRRLALTEISWTEFAVIVAMVVGAITAVVARQRIAVALGVATSGFMVAVLWVLWHAPDLALTQTIVETVSVVPLFLVFAYLPRLRQQPFRPKVEGINVFVSVLLGAVVTGFLLLSYGHQLFPSIGQFFVDNSLPLGGGRNVVNVILVDFRALDTMGEITVLTLVGLAVAALVRSRGEPADIDEKKEMSGVMINPLILPAFSRLLFYLILIYTIYIFFRGHHNPGGGFIAGVMAASALIIWALAYERPAAMALVPVEPRRLMGSGLLLVASLGLGAVLFGYPFLTQGFTEIELPWFGRVELATALLFDLGVWLVVIGSIKGIVMELSDGRPIAHETGASHGREESGRS